MTYTNLAQSKVLVDLGLDPETADLTIISDAVGAYPHEGTRGTKEYPCWSAEALLTLLPGKIYESGNPEDEDDWDYSLDVDKEGDNWFVGYRHNFDKTHQFYAINEGGELVPVLFAIFQWLLENKHL